MTMMMMTMISLSDFLGTTSLVCTTAINMALGESGGIFSDNRLIRYRARLVLVMGPYFEGR